MLIECGSCRARYRVKPSMLKGFKGAEVRCRKCGGMIVVLTPGVQARTHEDGRVEQRATPRRQSPAKKKAVRAVENEMAPPVPNAQGQEQMEAAVQAGMALIEETASAEAVPDTASQVDLLPEVAPERPPSELYDISGQIRTDLVPPPSKKAPSGESPLFSAFSLEKEAIRSISPGELFTREKEGGDPMFQESLIPSRDTMETPEKSSSGRSQFQIGFPVSMGPRPSHVAIVYLLLVLLGGCGYLLIRLLSQLANGRIG
jgi:predicted Zn finger-like uncharacterized protein